MNGFGDYIPDLTSDRSSDEENTFDDFMEEREKLTKKTMEKIEKLKKEGNDYVSSTKYTLAIEKYEKALEANEAIKHNRERHHDYYVKLKNNISHCYMKRKMYVPALDAAVDGLELDPKKHVGRSYQRAAFAFIKLDKIEIAYYTLKKAMFLCDEGDKDEVSKDLQNLLNDNSDLYRIKDKNWSAVRIKNFADEVKADIPPESEVPKRPKKTNEDKQKAKEAKAKEEEERKWKEEDERKRKELEERLMREEVERKAKEKSRKEMEEQIAMSALSKTMQKQIQFDECMKKASEAMMNDVAITAFENTTKALEILKTNYKNLDICKDLDEANNPMVVTLRYIHARAGVETSNYQNIMIAKETYEYILDFHKAVRFPAVYYGLALLFKKLNRFEEAIKWVEKALLFLEKGLVFPQLCWPGYSTQLLKETVRVELEKLLKSLLKELKELLNLTPDAVCMYGDCTTHSHQTHILPSKNIYLSDTDYKGHYKLICLENCRLDYHKTCWQLLKQEQEAHTTTEKDFISRQCLTPDCEGIIIKVEIHNQFDEVKIIEDAKLMERLEEEAKKRKMEDKLKRKEESKSFKNTNAAPRKKHKKKKYTESPDSEDMDLSEHTKGSTPDIVYVDSSVADNDALNEVPVEQIDYSKIDLSTATVLNKNAKQEAVIEVDGESAQAKKKKSKKKAQPMSLQEFQASTLSTENTANEFDSRIQKANKYKSLIEKIGGVTPQQTAGATATGAYPWSAEPTPASNHTSQLTNNNNNNTAWSGTNHTQSSNGGVVSAVIPSLEPEITLNDPVLIESLFDYLAQLLQQFGPLLCNDEKIWLALENYKDEINSFDNGLRSFIYMDPNNRFREHKGYICLLDDLAKVLKMPSPSPEGQDIVTMNPLTEGDVENPPAAVEEIVKNGGVPSDEDIKWLEVKQLLGMESKPAPGDVTESVTSRLTALTIGSSRTVASGTQTDVSSIDLDDSGMDPFTLAQTNENLVEQLQDTKDLLFRSQQDNKVSMNQLKERSQQLIAEKSRLQSELNRLKEQSIKDRKIAQDCLEKEKGVKERHDALTQKNKQLSNELESEQKLSFELNQSMVQHKGEIKTLKVFNIKVEAEYYKSEITTRLNQVKHFSKILEELRHNPVMTQHAEEITKSQVEVDNYSARLMQAQIDIEETLTRMLNNLPENSYPTLNFDSKRLEMPKLDFSLFLFFLDIKADTSRRLNDAITTVLQAAEHQRQEQHRHQLAAASPPMRPVDPRMLLGQDPGAYGLSAGPPPTSPQRRGAQSSSDGLQGAQGGPPPQASLVKNPMAKLQGNAGDGLPGSAREPPSNLPGFPVGPTSRVNAFSPPLSRPPGSSSPFRNQTPPPMHSPTPPTSSMPPGPPPPMGQRMPMMQAGYRPPQMRADMNQQMGVRAGVPFLVERPPPPMPSGGQIVHPGGGMPRGKVQQQQGQESSGESRADSTVEAGRKKNEDRLVDSICRRYENIDREKARTFVKQVRQNNGGKLTGMSVPTILNKVHQLASADESKDCSICLCELPDRPYQTPCGHQFHKQCLDQWLDQETSGNLCPNCREFLTNNDEFPSLR